MSGSTFGNKFKITTWGESHGKALGVVVDGCPAGLPAPRCIHPSPACSALRKAANRDSGSAG